MPSSSTSFIEFLFSPIWIWKLNPWLIGLRAEAERLSFPLYSDLGRSEYSDLGRVKMPGRLYICFKVGSLYCFNPVQEAASVPLVLVSWEAKNVGCLLVKTWFCLQFDSFGLLSCFLSLVVHEYEALCINLETNLEVIFILPHLANWEKYLRLKNVARGCTPN